MNYTVGPFEESGPSTLDAATGWLSSLVTSSLAVSLCVIAIAVLGILMFGGRLSVRTGVRTVLGCFVLLGAPVIASAFMTAGQDSGDPSFARPPSDLPDARVDLPPSAFDPYAGASLRQD